MGSRTKSTEPAGNDGQDRIEISVLVPFYNEEDNVEPLYRELVEVLEADGRRFELVFVNDGSRDGTTDVLDRLAEADSRVVAIHLVRNFGQTAAMSAAIDQAAGELMVGLDGDRHNDPNDIPEMLEKLNEGFDVVSGWRRDRKDSRSRTLPSQIANWLISRVSGVQLHDYGCSLKVYRRDVIKGVRLYGEMHRFIPIYTKWMGGRVTEMVVNHRPRVAGKSKYGMKRIFKVVLDLLLVRFLDRYLTKPIHFFGGAGLISIGLAFLAGLYALFLKLFEGVSYIETPLPLLSAMGFMIGVLLVLMGILAELIVRTYFEGQDKRTYQVRVIRNGEEA
ncbi:MAG: glycosyltransferase family 2 protein [Alphaproteobacteria bacterium]|nr:glycosyltransferase family 2 protein [Alphaproteobacteria bacterium]